MAADDEALRRLRDAVSELASADAVPLLAEARAEAHAWVRSLLSEAMTRSLLEAVERELRPAVTEPNGGAAPTGGALRVAPPEPAGVRAPAPDRRAPDPRAPDPRAPDARASAPGRRAPVPDLPAPAGGEVALYVYGVIPAAQAAFGLITPGIAEDRVRVLAEGELAAVLSEVPLADFDEQQLRAHLADMAWVERTAMRHEEVLEAIAAVATVVPMRMCTVYGGEEGIRELLRREKRALSDALAYLDGKAEWSVKVFADPVPGAAPSEPRGQRERDSSGAAYLQRRLEEREASARAAQEAEAAALEVHERLCAVAADAVIAPTQRPQVSGHAAQMVLNGVYLVADDAEERFHAEAGALAAEFAATGLVLDTSGPWPAYNFVPGTIGAAW